MSEDIKTDHLDSSNCPPEQLKTLKVIHDVYNLFKDDKEKFLVFRGLPDIDYALESAAARRFRNNNEKSQLDFINYHKVLLDEIKTGHYKGINNEDLAQMSELELLAQVQHLGGATCLTDFSLNLLVSLWFATNSVLRTEKTADEGKTEAENKEIADEGKKGAEYENAENKNNQETHGALYVINLHSEQNREKFLDIMSLKEREKTSMEDILTYKCEERVSDEHFWYWKPRKTNGRVNNQSSIFIFGLPAIEDTYYEIVPINKDDKAEIRRELKTYFGLDVKTIFPDLQGFSLTANSHKAKLYKKFNQNCLDIARDYLISKDFNACMNHLSEIRECEESADRTACKRHISVQKCDWKYERKYLEAKCQNMKARDEYEKKQSSDDKKMGHISYTYLVNCQEKAIDELYEAMRSTNGRIRFNCVVALFNCFFDIVICEEEYLIKDIHKRCFTDEDYKNEYEVKPSSNDDGLEEGRPEESYSKFSKLVYVVNKYMEEQENQTSLCADKRGFKLVIEDIYLICFAVLELSIFANSRKTFKDYKKNIKRLFAKKMYLNAGLLLNFYDFIANIVFKSTKASTEGKERKGGKLNYEWEFETIQHSIGKIMEKAHINSSRLNEICEQIEAEICGSVAPSREIIGKKVSAIESEAELSLAEVEKEHKVKKLEDDDGHTDIFSFTLKWDYEDMKHWLKHKFGDNTSLIILCNEMKRMQESWMYRMFETAHTFTQKSSEKVKAAKNSLEPEKKDTDRIFASNGQNTDDPSGK